MNETSKRPIHLAPSILAADFARLGEQVKAAEAADAESWASGWSSVKLHAGQEVNVLASDGKTVHLLVYDAPYVHSPASGNPLDCDTSIPAFADVLAVPVWAISPSSIIRSTSL